MKRTTGFLYLVFPAMLTVVALTAFVSGRDLSQTFNELATAGAATSQPVVQWAQRIVSVILLLAAGERIAHHFATHQRMPSPVLTAAFVTYWLAAVAAPAMFSAHPELSHEYLYPLVFGFAIMLATVPERDKILDATRTALFLFMLVGVLLIPVMPAMVMDATYTQGLIPGLPRHGGLAPHPVALGMFAQLALLILWARPFRSRAITFAAWLLGLGVLFIAQSKTAWASFILCALCMLAVRKGPATLRRLGDPNEGAFGVVVCIGAILVALALMGVLLFADVGAQFSGFSETTQGAQLISLTGRDQIWTIAWEEWRANPVFGYGPSIWSEEFRQGIGLPNATNAHNQFMDTLARSGTVGAVGLVIYGLVLMVMSFRYARATGGLSLALFLALALLSISEVPLILFGYGTELFGHLLLVVTLASAAGARVPAARTRARPIYGTAA